MIKTVLVYLYISLNLAYIIYQNIQQHKEKRTHKNSNTESYAKDILNSLRVYTRVGYV